jgi:hypothetical protein
MMTLHRVVLAVAALVALSTGAEAQSPPGSLPGAPAGRFIEIILTDGRAPVWIAASEVVRVAEVGNQTVLDTTAWVQQRTDEQVEPVARRLAATGLRLVPLTDLNNRRVYLAADRVVIVRGSQERYAAGARSAVVMVGLRYNTEVAVRELPEEVVAAVRRVRGGSAAQP